MRLIECVVLLIITFIFIYLLVYMTLMIQLLLDELNYNTSSKLVVEIYVFMKNMFVFYISLLILAFIISSLILLSETRNPYK